MWPAFWMLGSNRKEVGWPRCGEIDILENIGREPSAVHATVHGPGYSGGEGVSAFAVLPGGASFFGGFHVFALEWLPESIAFFLDGTEYARVTPASLPKGAPWVFQQPFYLILNLAVGGDWPGSPDETTVFPQEMLVDYVRVWQR
jgi:beta-glucanase (GH16 family)